ncbi:T9SS type A sorting domain-containing protein [Pontibacter sp. KCTC 32443]|uniref:malectin domain-containing carbohydrate-binding protein n=1 Tax=Pontibacter TaxID=323449 RepID=UPI00164CEF86|nr:MULTISPECIES: malectin domain-containing carbohydrate-binding protein [Pontibacter]MBC5773723.1 T9SS type A sorting domain-containing protein [Pontibacter sp. KCTC 32443]
MPLSPKKKCFYKLTFIVLFSLLITFFNNTYAQISSTRVTDWTKAGVVGGIPSGGSEILAVNYGIVADGITDNTLAINNLLKSSASLDKIIKFPAGIIRCEGYITLPAVGRRIIRGTLSSTGEKLTKFIFNTGATSTGNFVLQGSYTTSEVSVISGFTKGSTQLVVSSSSGLAAGDYIEIRQNNDPVLMNSYISPDYNTGSRSIGQVLRIASVSANTLTLQKPLRFSYNVGGEFYPKIRKFVPAQQVGFEDFYTECLQDGAKWTFRIARSANSWIKNVHSYKSVRVHVELATCINMTVRDSYFHDSFNHGGGGNGYGVLTTGRTTDCLIENNTFRRLRHSMMADHGANGNVFGYNKSSEAYSSTSTNIPSDISIHGYFSHMNLFEGNLVENIHSADQWGPSGPGTTFFRNRVTKERLRIDDYSVDNNVAGNEVITRYIDVHSTTKGTFVHGNVVGGVTTWASGAGTDNLQASYYLSQKPAFLATTDPWPLYGPKPVQQVVAAPSAPTANTATAISQTGFTATWTTSTGTDSYRIDVSTSSNFSSYITGYQNKTVAGNTLQISGLNTNTTYYYRVRAVNTGGTSASSNTISVTTLAAEPVNELVNNAPIVTNPILDQTATVGITYTYTFPTNTFNDTDGDGLTYTATLSDGSPLPSWLTFNASTRTFSGSPVAVQTGYIDIKVTATDPSKALASDTFRLTIKSSSSTGGSSGSPDGTVPSAIRINVGGNDYIAQAGTFIRDTYFKSVQSYTGYNSKSVSNTTDSELYQYYRTGEFSYNIPVSSGDYKVVLHFNEVWGISGKKGVGTRLFNVKTEGILKLTNYDIFARTGSSSKAIYESVNVNVADGLLNIDFIPVKNGALVSAIEVIPISTTTTSSLNSTDTSGIGIMNTETVSNLLVYPNPVDEQIFVEFLSTYKGDVQITLLDQLGRKHLELKPKDLTGKLNINIANLNLTHGVYFLVVTSEGKKEVKKIVKK